MNEEESLKGEENLKEETSGEETVEVVQSNNMDCEEKPCADDCTAECKGAVINKITFFKSLEMIAIDQIIIFILSAVGILLLSLILNIFGYFILSSYYIVFLFIAYVSISILYPVIMEACIGNTLGRKICKLKIFKAE
jgi:hypothetical protein